MRLIAALAAVVVLAACDLSYPSPPSVNINDSKPVVTAPVITWFTAELFQQKGGTRTTISWDVVGASTTCRIDPGVGNVQQTGNTSILLPLVASPQPVTYTLSCANSGGGASRQLQILVTP